MIILETGRMGEPINGLQKMALGRHRYVQIKEGDLVHSLQRQVFQKKQLLRVSKILIYKAGGVVKLITQTMNVFRPCQCA